MADWHAKNAKDEYKNEIVPMFRRKYRRSAGNFASELLVEDETYYDGGAGPQYIFITTPVARWTRSLRFFAIAHELSHVVTTEQVAKFGLTGVIPGNMKENLHKGEYLADLIACQMLCDYKPGIADSVKSGLQILRTALGNENFSHPSGTNRTDLMREFFEARSTFLRSQAHWRFSQAGTLGRLCKRVWNAVGQPWKG